MAGLKPRRPSPSPFISKNLCWCGCRWVCGRSEHFPVFAWQNGGSAAFG